MHVPAGDCLPAGDPFGVSVSLPAWTDTVAWAKRDAVFMAKLKTGYPRFFIPLVVEHLSRLILEHAENLRLLPAMTPNSAADEPQSTVVSSSAYSALLLVNVEAAALFRSYLLRCKIANQQTYRLSFDGRLRIVDYRQSSRQDSSQNLCIYVVLFPREAAVEGKSFWQHAGFGISSRCATYWLHYGPLLTNRSLAVSMPATLPSKESLEARNRLCSRIAGWASGPDIRVKPDDIFLYPTGMSAIETTASILESITSPDKQCRVAVFGFLYVDTYKVLSKVHGFDCVLYGHASSCDLDKLEHDLAADLKIDALYTEFPGNPLMVSPDLARLGKLSGEYGFLLIVDETIGTSVNISLIAHCDILCTSLTKMFSGGCNVMGGSIALNPRSSRHYQLTAAFQNRPICPYFCHDVIVMEENSKDFPDRVAKASSNAAYIAAILRSHSSVSEVFYPRESSSQSIYDRYRRPGRGYGFLISIQFRAPSGAMAFHDAFHVAKGPSLGTNFTLCCAYTLLAHYKELEWAAEFGVTEHLVRISVGIEETTELERIVRTALEAAQTTM